LSTVVVKSVDEGAVRRAMDAYAAWLLDHHPNVEEVVVFGSFERGTWAPGSDLDVFVRLSSAECPIHERVTLLLPGAFPVGIDLFPFTTAEVEERRPSPLLDAVDSSRWRYRRKKGPALASAGLLDDAPVAVTPGATRARRIAVTRFSSCGEAELHDREYWRAIQEAERVALVWRLSVEQWRLAGLYRDEPGLCRSVASVRRA
jgi:predicted nucleotidyltransferase